MPRKTQEQLIKIGEQKQLIEIKDHTIKYVIQQKEYDKDPEEYVRACTYVELVEEYNYSPYRIDIEVLVPRRSPGDFADIVVYKDDEKLDNFIVIENKQENCNQDDFYQGIEQGFGNANSLRAKFLVIDNFRKKQVYDVGGYPPNERSKNIISDLPINYGLVPTYRFIREPTTDLNIVGFDELAQIFQKCHNIIWSGGKEDPATAFDEMSKILFAKITDERKTPNGEHYKFQVGRNENEVIVGNRIRSLYENAREIDQSVFSESIQISDIKIKEVVNVLQQVSLANTDLDAKGQAFEKFLGVIFRGELGQFFTRRQIVEFVVNILNPTEDDIILDPSCGSGGFLLYSMKHVGDEIKRKFSGDNELITRKIINFNSHNLFGIEINSKIARVAMMDMIVNNDGHTNIENNTGLNSTFTNQGITYGKFTLIMTNPPFGVNIKRSDREQLGQNTFPNFIFGGSKKSQLSDILFLEQYIKFLSNEFNKNPRLGVVLQTGVLNNPSNKNVLNWIRTNCKILAVISLPDFAFRKAGSGMKTCLLFLNKYPNPYKQLKDVPNYKIFFAIANHIGYDSTLRTDTNDLINIHDHYKKNTQDLEKNIFWLNLNDLDYRLDPTYYRLRFVVREKIKLMQDKGIVLVPLRKLKKNFNAGKSPNGGVTRSTGEIPSITIANITRDGHLDFTDTLNFVPDIFFDEFKSSKGELQIGDILIAKDGATTGKTAMIDESFQFMEKTGNLSVPKAIFSEHIFRLSLKEGISPSYVNAFLNSELGQMQLEMVTSGGAQGGITTEFIDNIFVPIVNEKLQKEISTVWNNGIRESNELIDKYKQTIEKAKSEIDEVIKSSLPLTKAEIKKILND